MNRKIKSAAGNQDAEPALTPKLRFPEFRDVAGWELREIGGFLSESRLPGSKGNVAKKITVKLWGNGVFGKNEAVQGSVNTQYFRRRAGQFIYSKLDFLNQAFGVIPASLDNFESTVDLPCFDIKDGLNSVFLLEYVKRKGFYERVGEAADGSRKARRIHAETFLGFSVAIPSLPEQQKIAECLTTLDEVIAAQSQKLDALKTHKKGLMQQLFPREGETLPRLRFPEFQDAPEWKEKRLGGMCQRIMDGTHFSPKTKSGPRAYLTSKNIQDGKIDLSNLSYISEEEHREIFKRCPVKLNDVLLTKDGANTGNCAINDLTFEFSLLSSVAVLRGNPTLLDQRFLYQAILSDRTQTLIRESMSGQAITRITLEKIGNFSIHFAALEEQQRIATCLTSLDDLITAHSAKLSALKTHKKGLMQQLFPSPEEAEA